MYKYEIGKQVVCISKNDKPWPNYFKTAEFSGCPKPGQILTVRDIRRFQELLGLQFYELSVPVGDREAWFQAKEFRPVKDTNIDELIKLANPVNEKKRIEVS